MSGSKGVRSKKLNPSEKAIETAILMFLNFQDRCFAWKNNNTGIYDKKLGKFRKNKNKYVINGVSDILGMWRGRLLAIEVKRPCNKDRPPEQIDFIEKVKALGGIAGFATSIEDVKQILREQECTRII